MQLRPLCFLKGATLWLFQFLFWGLSGTFCGASFHVWVNLGHLLGYQHVKDLTENLGCRTNGLQRDTAVVHLNLLKYAAATRLSRKQVILVHLLSQNFRESSKSSDMVAEVEKEDTDLQNNSQTWDSMRRATTGLWLARNEGMEKKMNTTTMGYIGTTARIMCIYIYVCINPKP